VNDREVHFNRCYITTTLVPDGEITTCFHLRLMELISMVRQTNLLMRCLITCFLFCVNIFDITCCEIHFIMSAITN
jgi:hypothetical protein